MNKYYWRLSNAF